MWFVFHLIAVVAGYTRILSRSDMVAATRLAWMLAILVLPIIGFALYYLFSEAGREQPAPPQAEAINCYIYGLSQRDASNGSIRSEFKPVFDYVRSINGFDVCFGNGADLMTSSDTARKCLIDDIDSARHSVEVLYYIWLTDNTGTDVAKALMRAARRGVRCRAMADGVGSRRLVKSPLWTDMRDAGVHTVIARPIRNILKTILVSRLDLRNHRKMTIIDGDITYCGSQNCADAAFQHKSRFAPWIDVMVRFTGPIATQNRQLFECDWAIQTGQDLPSPKGVCAPEGETLPAIVWGDGPMNRLGTSQQMFATLFGQARQSLTITTPYFVPGDIVLEALCACAWRGVKVTLILPARNDSWFVSAASRSHYATMLASGIEIFEYNAGLLHSKTVTIDETVGLVGSSNLDRRSFDLNYENNILFHDRVLTQAIRERQDTYILSSTSVTTAHVAAWPLRRRIWNNLIATAGPIL